MSEKDCHFMVSAIWILNWPKPRSLKLHVAKSITSFFKGKKNPNINCNFWSGFAVGFEFDTWLDSMKLGSQKCSISATAFQENYPCFKIFSVLPPLRFLCCICIFRGLMMSCGLFVSLVQNSLPIVFWKSFMLLQSSRTDFFILLLPTFTFCLNWWWKFW